MNESIKDIFRRAGLIIDTSYNPERRNFFKIAAGVMLPGSEDTVLINDWEDPTESSFEEPTISTANGDEGSKPNSFNPEEGLAEMETSPEEPFAEAISDSEGFQVDDISSEIEREIIRSSTRTDLNSPNDEYFLNQWHLGEYPGLEWYKAWDLLKNIRKDKFSDSYVVVMDSGINSSHPDLQNSLATEYGKSFVNEEEYGDDPYTDLVGYHGTAIAGIIAANTNNEIGVSSVGNRQEDGNGFPIKAISMRVLNPGGWVAYRDIKSGLEETLRLVREEKADIKVLTMSFAAWPIIDTSEMDELLTELHNEGVILVAGSGNSADKYSTVAWPARHEHVIAVTGIDRDGSRRDSANTDDEVFAAPAQQIWSTMYDEDYDGIYGPYGSMSGTSYAGPQIAALAAIYKSIYPEMSKSEVPMDENDTNYPKGSPEDFRELLIKHSNDYGYTDIGYGMPNVYEFLEELLMRERVLLPWVMGN